MLRLIVTAGPHQGREFRFENRDTFLVGRSRGVHFALPEDSYLSRFQFLIEVNPPLCCLHDLQSKNGTHVNGNRVRQHFLRHGDEISVGVTKLRVELPTGSGSGSGLSRRSISASLTGDELLEELLDLQARLWERGQCVGIEEFLAQYPQVQQSPELLVGLIVQELELRRDCGEPVPATEYLIRFPDLVTQLQEEFSRQEAANRMVNRLQMVEDGTELQVQTPAAPDPVVPGFHLLHRLGEGGMGVVYQARASNGEIVAVKMIRPAVAPDRLTVARFLRETEIVRRLRHPHIVGHRQSGEHAGLLYFAMDFIDGLDAQRHVETHGIVTVLKAIDWTLQLLEALEFAHARGYVHRDIKPANLLIGRRNGRDWLYLTDFGLARTYTDSQLSGLTCTGMTGGTLGYIAPEQILDFRNVQPASDQYSAAATLYHLLTAAHIYERRGNNVEMLKRVLTEEPIALRDRRPDLPESLARVIHKALARQPEARYPDVAAFGRALREEVPGV